MSLADQERLLFELLFDDAFRARFAAEGAAVLAESGLDAGERADFEALRTDALEIDARMRRSMVLSQLCVTYPLTFAIAVTQSGGLEQLHALVDVRTMRTPAIERAVVFGRRLREALDEADEDDAVGTGLRTILETELGMAWTAASVRREMLDVGRAPSAPAAFGDDWLDVPVRVTAFVSASILPAPRAALREALCPVPDRELWRWLTQDSARPSEAAVAEVLGRDEARLLVARAEIDRPSRCDPTASHRTVELSEGFASLVGHANGGYSVRSMLDGMQASGADARLLTSIEAGFRELCDAGMLEPAG